MRLARDMGHSDPVERDDSVVHAIGSNASLIHPRERQAKKYICSIHACKAPLQTKYESVSSFRRMGARARGVWGRRRSSFRYGRLLLTR